MCSLSVHASLYSVEFFVYGFRSVLVKTGQLQFGVNFDKPVMVYRVFADEYGVFLTDFKRPIEKRIIVKLAIPLCTAIGRVAIDERIISR